MSSTLQVCCQKLANSNITNLVRALKKKTLMQQREKDKLPTFSIT